MKKQYIALVLLSLFTLAGCKPSSDKFIGDWVKDKQGNVTISITDGKKSDLDVKYESNLGGFIEKHNWTAELKSKEQAVIDNEIKEDIIINADGKLLYEGKTYHKK